MILLCYHAEYFRRETVNTKQFPKRFPKIMNGVYQNFVGELLKPQITQGLKAYSGEHHLV